MRPTIRVCFALVLSTAAFSHPANAGPIAGLDAMTSTVMQENQTSLSGLALRARVTSARIIPAVDFLPSVEYWRSRTTVSTFGIEASRRDATLGVDARYTFRREGWSPYAGVGLGVHFLSIQVDAPTLGLAEAEDSLVKGGLAFLGGITFPLSDRITNLIEVKYHHLSDYGQVKLNWGIGWDF